MRKSVLIVEDDPDIVTLVTLYLKQDGHKVMTASTGSQGLRLARESKPDLIILDLMLPRLDGMEICRVLRDEGSRVPIIMLTALVEEANLLQGLYEHYSYIYYVLRKPIPLWEVYYIDYSSVL